MSGSEVRETIEKPAHYFVLLPLSRFFKLVSFEPLSVSLAPQEHLGPQAEEQLWHLHSLFLQAMVALLLSPLPLGLKPGGLQDRIIVSCHRLEAAGRWHLEQEMALTTEYEGSGHDVR